MKRKTKYAVVSVLIPEKSYNKLVDRASKRKKTIPEKLAGNMLVKAINAAPMKATELKRGEKEMRSCACGCGRTFEVGFATRHKVFFGRACAAVHNAKLRKDIKPRGNVIQRSCGKGVAASLGGKDVI